MNKWSQEKIGTWKDKIFGESNSGLIAHFAEEVVEFLQALGTDGEPLEAADVVILLMVRAEKRGYNLLDSVDTKMDINDLRKWLPPDENGIVRHAPE